MPIFWHIDKTSFDSGVLKRIDNDSNITKISLMIHKQVHGFYIMQSSQKHPRLEIAERKSTIRIWEGQKSREVQVSGKIWFKWLN